MAKFSGYRVSVTEAVGGIALYTGTDTSGGMLIVKNSDSANSVDLGDSAVIYGEGYQLKPGDILTLSLSSREKVYARANVGQTVVLHILTEDLN